MATFRAAPERATQLLADIEASFQSERASKGREKPHVSDVIHCLKRAWLIRNDMVEQGPREPEDSLRLMVGHALHAVVARSANKSRAVNVPIETEWFIGEADAIVFGEDGGIEDAKTTYMSTSKGPMPLLKPEYVEQIATYLVGWIRKQNFVHRPDCNKGMCWCEIKGLDDVPLRAIIHALYICGNYKPAFQSKLITWEIEFTPEELLRWAAEVERRTRLILGDTEPINECGPAGDKTKGLSWECGYCPLLNNGCAGEPGRPSGFFALDPVDGDY